MAATVAVIIPVLDEEQRIATAIERAWLAGADEVIVVDGGSSDQTLAVASAQRCVLLSSVRGRAVQQNAGAQAARSDVLLFLHADTWLPAAAVDRIRSAVRRGATAGAFEQRIEAEGLAYRMLEFGNSLRVRMLGVAYGDQGIFIRRELFQQVGGFAPVRLMEDLLLSRSLRAHTRLRLLRGPLQVSARRWQHHGVVRQTLRNWSLLTAHALGVSTERLADYYAPNSGASQPATASPNNRGLQPEQTEADLQQPV